MRKFPHTLIGCFIASFVITALVPSVASGQTMAQNAQNLNIGFNGPNRQLPYMTTFYAATNAYYRSIGSAAMPGNRHCHAYLSWDIAENPIGSGNINREGTRAWLEDWLKHAQGQCDEALLTFKYIDGVSKGKGFPTPADFEAAFKMFQSISWAYTGWTGTFAFTAWNEPNNGAPSGDGLSIPVEAKLAADYYLALRKYCTPPSCSVAAGDFGSNGHLGNGFVQNCTRGVATLCRNASYLDQYKYYLANDAASYGLGSGTSFRPEMFAYHGWDDINDYINHNPNCGSVKDHNCTTWVLLNSLSSDSWANSEIWDTEVGAGQNPQSNPDAITQACAASFLLRLTATAGARITRIYYTRPYENDGEHWSLFTPSGDPKPAFTVLANRDTSYAPPGHKKCP
jgi:hypothetical protein